MAHTVKRARVRETRKREKRARLGARGRVVLPAEVRRRLRVSEGDELVFVLERDGRVLISTADDRLSRVQAMFRDAPGKKRATLLSNELLRERREEAGRE